MIRRAAISAILVLFLLAGCGVDDRPWTYQGQPGKAVPMWLRAWVPQVKVMVSGESSSRDMMVDTGSPLTILASRSFPALPTGRALLTLGAFGLTFPDYPGTVMSIFNDGGACVDTRPDGLVGGDLLGAFRLGLDYQGRRAMLFAGEGVDPAVAPAVDQEQRVPLQVMGGGWIQAGEDLISVPATRVVVDNVLLEGRPARAVVDTGASITLLSKELLQALGQTGRPRLCCAEVALPNGFTKATLYRLKELRIGALSVKNLPVMVLNQEVIFSAASEEVGRKVDLLLGGSFLRQFAVRLDYSGGELGLSRYLKQSHIDPDEFVGPGFSFCSSAKNPGEVVVLDVYEGSDAQAKGVRPGDLLRAVNGVAISHKSLAEVYTVMEQHKEGSRIKLEFSRPTGAVILEVLVERMLGDMK